MTPNIEKSGAIINSSTKKLHFCGSLEFPQEAEVVLEVVAQLFRRALRGGALGSVHLAQVMHV